MSKSLGLSDRRGALVSKIESGGPADKAGIKDGDVVLSFDEKEVSGMWTLPRLVAAAQFGRPADDVVWRAGGRSTLSVVVGEMPASSAGSAQGEGDRWRSGSGGSDGGAVLSSLGLRVSSTDPNASKRQGAGALDAAAGVFVEDVKAGSAAAEKGLRVGERIVEAGRKPVREVQDLVGAVESAAKDDAKSILLRVEGADSVRYVALPLPEGRK